MTSTNDLLYQILDNQQVILQELKMIRNELNTCKSTNDKMVEHINFVENVYDVVKSPINYLIGTNLVSIETISSGNKK